MPEDTPPAKLQATQGYGAEIITYDRWRENREEIGARLRRTLGRAREAVRRPARDGGPGNVALELLEDVPTSTC